MRRPVRELPRQPGHPFRLRRMLASDLEAVVRINREAFEHPWSADLFQRELGHDWSTTLLAEELALPGPLGFVIFWSVHDEIHILNLATAPLARRRGVARALLGEVLRRGQGLGAVLATLEVRRSNAGARLLYAGLGFREVGVRPNYYVDEGEDAIVMNCDL